MQIDRRVPNRVAVPVIIGVACLGLAKSCFDSRIETVQITPGARDRIGKPPPVPRKEAGGKTTIKSPPAGGKTVRQPPSFKEFLAKKAKAR